MTQDAVTNKTARSRAVLLLPIAYWLHLAEEWFGGFIAWTSATLGSGVSVERFVAINAIGLVLFFVVPIAAFRNQNWIWPASALAALFGLNGVLHALATAYFGTYSPGTVTGLLIYLPLSVIVLRHMSLRMSAPKLVGSMLAGCLLHALVTFVAFY